MKTSLRVSPDSSLMLVYLSYKHSEVAYKVSLSAHQCSIANFHCRVLMRWKELSLLSVYRKIFESMFQRIRIFQPARQSQPELKWRYPSFLAWNWEHISLQNPRAESFLIFITQKVSFRNTYRVQMRLRQSGLFVTGELKDHSYCSNKAKG